jgi:ribonucleoside-triphosphate reductase
VKAQNRGVSKPTDLRYEHFQQEMNLINKAYYTVMTEGDANGQRHVSDSNRQYYRRF